MLLELGYPTQLVNSLCFEFDNLLLLTKTSFRYLLLFLGRRQGTKKTGKKYFTAFIFKIFHFFPRVLDCLSYELRNCLFQVGVTHTLEIKNRASPTLALMHKVVVLLLLASSLRPRTPGADQQNTRGRSRKTQGKWRSLRSL